MLKKLCSCLPSTAEEAAPTISEKVSPAPLLHPPRRGLTESQRKMYKLEREVNFRWIARFLASSSQRVLTNADLVSRDVQQDIAEIGQYAEVAHGSIDPEFVWRNLNRLVSPTYPLEGYNALVGSQLVCAFHGRVAKVQGYIAYRPAKHQLIIAFSGTSTPAQALHDVDARFAHYPVPGEKTSESGMEPKVHRGIWKMYQGVRQLAFDNFAKELLSLDIAELILTGHSLGAALASLFALELLQNSLELSGTEGERLPPSIVLRLVGFGVPRVGNEGLARHYRKLVSDYREARGKDNFQEYTVKGYNDGMFPAIFLRVDWVLLVLFSGVPCLPPKAFGYKHLCSNPLYLFHGQLFNIPLEEVEHSFFPVLLDGDVGPPEYPFGGHNYYNNRDMEKIQRRIRCLKLLTKGETGWEDRYRRYLTKESPSDRTDEKSIPTKSKSE